MTQGVSTASPVHALPAQLAARPGYGNEAGRARTALIWTVLSHDTLND